MFEQNLIGIPLLLITILQSQLCASRTVYRRDPNTTYHSHCADNDIYFPTFLHLVFHDWWLSELVVQALW